MLSPVFSHFTVPTTTESKEPVQKKGTAVYAEPPPKFSGPHLHKKQRLFPQMQVQSCIAGVIYFVHKQSCSIHNKSYDLYCKIDKLFRLHFSEGIWFL